MAHILILGHWKTRINELYDRTETLHDNMENEMYEGEELTEAQQLMASAESSVAGDLNAETIDGVIDALKNFLGA